MIRARIVNKVPRNAVNIAYIFSPPFTPNDNISLQDLSYERPENIVTRGGDVVVPLSGALNRVETDNVTLSRRSVLRRDTLRPIPLYYKYQLPYSVYSRTSGTIVNKAVETDIRQEITLLDRNNEPITNLDWDLEVSATDGAGGYTTTLYLPRRQTEDETFKVKYHAKSGVTLYPNHIDVINATPELTINVDYTLQEEADGFSIQGLDAALNAAPGIGIFYKGTGASGVVTVSATNITFPRDGGGTDTYTLAGKSINDLVIEINEAGLAAWFVVALSECSVATLATGSTTVYPRGATVTLPGYTHAKYQEEVKMRVLGPYNDPTTMPWYPRIDPGQFLVDGTIGAVAVKFLYGVPEYATQAGSFTHNRPYRDKVNDTPRIIGPRMLQVSRYPLKSSTITLYAKGKSANSDIDDIDLLNGIIFLNVDAVRSYTADYTYEERSYVYVGIDLNTTALHNRDIFGKYIGIYATPYKILSATIPQTFTTCIHHVVRDTYAEVVSAVAAVQYDDGSDPQAFLLGILRPVLTADLDAVKIADTRVFGGGLEEGIESTDEPETDFYSDIGRFDGEPFQDKGSVIVGVPSNVLGTGMPRIAASIPIPTTGYTNPVGTFSQDDILRASEEHLGAGRMAMIWSRTGLYVNPTGHIGTTVTPAGIGWTYPWGHADE